jgi:formylglycine-generating enzyme required for sulfatase activity
MTAAPDMPRPFLSRGSIMALAGLGAAVALFGAAQWMRGPELSSVPLPQMAERPVALPDGGNLFAMKYEVSVAQWNACYDAGACGFAVQTRPGHAPETTPATGLNHLDALAYVEWINAGTRHDFHLPTAAEWNAMAKAVLPDEPDPIFTDPSLSWASAYLTEGIAPRALKARGSFSTSPEGVADLDGSVWEWTQDCYAGVAEGVDPGRCPAYFVGGEHVAAMAYLERDPARGGCAVGAPPAHLGMRLVSDRPWSGSR